MKKITIKRWAALLIALSAPVFLVGPASGADRSYSRGGDAQIVVRRIPTLGRFVGVQFEIDGRNAGTLLYGHTFRTAMPSGHHILTVRGTPRRTFNEPWITSFNIHGGQTYTFTAYDAGTQVALRRN
jgi:hypothetical protein